MPLPGNKETSIRNELTRNNESVKDNKVKVMRLPSRTSVNCSDAVRDLTRLVRASKEVSEDVAPMMYGALEFRLYVGGHVLEWFRKLGSMRQHVRHLHIEHLPKTNIRPLFGQLKGARFIQIVTFWPDVSGIEPKTLAKGLKPFVQRLVRNKRNDQIVDDVLMVVRASSKHFYELRPIEEAKGYQTMVRNELAKLLA